ncbi:MAG: hypothetical protein RMX68_026520 [Aulosira sp. ZfuVER01]|nr:hypothetical protein [Aulosira sp. ZfuVER01]MDZ7999756.1 hypothetical protein [Aulosira sp. DedVER01a]MDZ8055131.1 hypothetical protein [Aulosira sp. ZfuCHP01]
MRSSLSLDSALWVVRKAIALLSLHNLRLTYTNDRFASGEIFDL